MKDQPLYDLRTCCEDALRELYPAGIPNEVSLRLEREINCLLQKPDYIDNFLLFKELSHAVKRTCGKLYLTGTITNSILIYLLGDHELNPMPAHYYCPNCGYYHEEPQAVVGLDLPERNCPHCRSVLRRDGFSLREEYVLKASSEMTFEYRMTSRVIPLARKVIERHYAGQHRHTALLGWQNSDQLEVSGMVILPAGKGLADYQEYVGITQDGKECLCYDWRLFERENLKKILLLRLNLLDILDKVQWETGTLADGITPEDLYDVSCQDILNTSVLEQGEFTALFIQRPKTFQEKMDLLSATHNTYRAEGSCDSFVSFQEFSKNPQFLSCPIYTRDDVFDMLRQIYKDADKAFFDAEDVRKGRGHDGTCAFSAEVPSELKKISQHISYLFPRAFGQWYMLQYMRLAKYLKLDRRTYCKVVWGSGCASS